MLKTALRLVMQHPLSFLLSREFIFGTVIADCVDYKGFRFFI